jgi:antitoxin component YwqK of YwqJK toxin-antitoxin module
MASFLKRVIILVAYLTYATNIIAQTNPRHVYVRPFVRSDGTRVEGHFRTAPNSTNRDNFSTLGNTNPYTGEAGYVTPDFNNLSQSTRPTQVYTSTIVNSNGKKVVKYQDGEEQFSTCTNCSNINYKLGVDYFSYTPQKGIQKTQGRANGTLLDGEYLAFDSNQKLRVKANYSRGLEHGDTFIYNSSGNVSEKVHYTNGLLDYCKFTNGEGVIIEWIGPILKTGSTKNVYTPDSRLLENTKVVGEFKYKTKTYNPSTGQLEGEFTKGVSEYYYDDYVFYTADGRIKVSGKFNNNIRYGIWHYLHDDGTSNDVTFRIFTDKYPNGNVKFEGSQFFNPELSSWIKEGKWIYYQPNGKDILKIEVYKNGVKKEEY